MANFIRPLTIEVYVKVKIKPMFKRHGQLKLAISIASQLLVKIDL